MITVKVVWQSSRKPAEGKKVSIGFDGLTRGVASDEFTDRNGEAHFDVKPGTGRIFVSGSTKFEGRIEGKVEVCI